MGTGPDALPTASGPHSSRGDAAMNGFPTRAEHLDWCKQRALEYCDRGDPTHAWASMVSDLRKHPDTEGHAGIQLGMLELMAGRLQTPDEMRTFLEGFN